MAENTLSKTVRLPKPVWADLRALAAKEQRPLNRLIADALKNLVNQKAA